MACDNNKMNQFFNEADTDKSGFLSIVEVYKVLRKSGCNMSQEEVVEMMFCIDKNKDQQISLEELKLALNRKDRNEIKEEDLRKQFQTFDKDGSGLLSADEIKKVLQELGVRGDPEEVIKQVDTNSDGKINIEEFIQAWNGGKK